MFVRPLADGSLLVERLRPAQRYDMGNQRLSVTVNGQGAVLALHLSSDGVDVGGWDIAVHLDDQHVAFGRARAALRLWEVSAELERVHLALATAIPDQAAALLQRLYVRNDAPHGRRATVTIALRPPRYEEARLLRTAATVPLLWARGAAKTARPRVIGPWRDEASGFLEVLAPVRCTWGASRPWGAFTSDGDRPIVTLTIEVPGNSEAELCWGFVRGGTDELRELLNSWPTIQREAEAYLAWLRQRAGNNLTDDFVRSMVIACCNAALANYKTFSHGFAGFLAGVDYAYPPRLYFRDGYWTSQVALKLRPDLVRAHVLSLACGVHPDGQCSSGVFVSSLLPFQANEPADLDWLPDHVDSPAFFILLVRDYIMVTGDQALLVEAIPYPFPRKQHHLRDVWSAVEAAGRHLLRCDRNEDGLLEKPYRPNDWCDNIRRSIWVTYDQALFTAALYALAQLARLRSATAGSDFWQDKAARARAALNTVLWDEELGHYIDYRRRGFCENHLAGDTLVAAYFDLVPPDRLPVLLRSVRRLLTKCNEQQPFGDWGVMNVFPHYRRQRDLFGKSSQPYHYHNGADWPYLDGILGTVLYRAEDPETLYVLTRWWHYGLAEGWLTPIEYYSPAFPPGGSLQAWSAMPASPFLD